MQKISKRKDLIQIIDLSDIEYEVYRKQILTILERHYKMWPRHLGQIKIVPHNISLELETRALR